MLPTPRIPSTSSYYLNERTVTPRQRMIKTEHSETVMENRTMSRGSKNVFQNENNIENHFLSDKRITSPQVIAVNHNKSRDNNVGSNNIDANNYEKRGSFHTKKVNNHDFSKVIRVPVESGISNSTVHRVSVNNSSNVIGTKENPNSVGPDKRVSNVKVLPEEHFNQENGFITNKNPDYVLFGAPQWLNNTKNKQRCSIQHQQQKQRAAPLPLISDRRSYSSDTASMNSPFRRAGTFATRDYSRFTSPAAENNPNKVITVRPRTRLLRSNSDQYSQNKPIETIHTTRTEKGETIQIIRENKSRNMQSPVTLNQFNGRPFRPIQRSYDDWKLHTVPSNTRGDQLHYIYNNGNSNNHFTELTQRPASAQPPFQKCTSNYPSTLFSERNRFIRNFSMDERGKFDNRPSGLPPRPLKSPIARSVQPSNVSTIDRVVVSDIPAIPYADEVTSTRIDPQTGEAQLVTSRTRTYTDSSQNAAVTETEESIQGQNDTEVHVFRRTVKKHKPKEIRTSNLPTHIQQKSEQEIFERRIEDGNDFRTVPQNEARPHRTTSQMHINQQAPLIKTHSISETNLRNTSCKQPPMYSTYSAHRENLRRMAEKRQNLEELQTIHQVQDVYSPGTRDIIREMETVTLQPIGRGVRDLEPSTGSIARSARAVTPVATRPNTPGWEQQDGFRTFSTTNCQRELHTSGPQSPYVGGSRGNAQYDAIFANSDTRNRSLVQQSETQWKTINSVNANPLYQTTSLSPMGSLGGTSGPIDMVDMDNSVMVQVLDTFKYWYLPHLSRTDAIAMLRDKEPGRFVIRNSDTYANSFGFALKIPPTSPRVPLRSDDLQADLVRHFLIVMTPMQDGRGSGVHLRGFAHDPIFPSLPAFVNYHLHKQGALPCLLRLPPLNQSTPLSQSRTLLNSNQHGFDAGISPMSSSLPGGGIAADMVYLGCVDVDRLDNSAAARRAISLIFSQAATHPNGLPKRCEVIIKAIPQDGITFSDSSKRTLLKKHIKPTSLLWCNMDPENRGFNDLELRSKGMFNAKIFAIVAKKQRLLLHENVVYVFCELDHNQSAINLVRYINSIFLGLRE